MNGYFLASYALLTFLLTDFVIAPCPENEVSVCKDELVRLKTEENLFPPMTEASLKEVCRMEKAVVDCIDAYASRCLTNYTLRIYSDLTTGARKIFDELCSEDSKLKYSYLKHSACIMPIREDIGLCILNYEESQKNMSIDTIPYDIQRACCSYFERVNCAATVVRQHCGQEAGQLMEEILTEPEGTPLSEKCSGLKSTCISLPNTSYSIHFTSNSIIVNIMSVIIVLLKSRYMM